MSDYSFESKWIVTKNSNRYEKNGTIQCNGIDLESLNGMEKYPNMEFRSRSSWRMYSPGFDTPYENYPHDSIGSDPSLIINGSRQPSTHLQSDYGGVETMIAPVWILNHEFDSNLTFGSTPLNLNQTHERIRSSESGCRSDKDPNGILTIAKYGIFGWSTSNNIRFITDEKVVSSDYIIGGGYNGNVYQKLEYSLIVDSPIIIVQDRDALLSILRGLNEGKGIEELTEFILNWGTPPEPPEPEPEDDGTHNGYFVKNTYKIGENPKQNKEVRWFSSVKRLAFWVDKSYNGSGVLATLSGNGKCKYTTAYSWTDHAQESDESPWTEFPFRTGYFEDGVYIRVSTFSTNIPIFKNKDLADVYIETGGNIDDALNLDQVKDLEIGTTETETTLSGSVMVSDFSKFYICDRSTMRSLMGVLNNTANYEDIKNGTQLLGDYALNCISSLMFFPIAPELFTSNNMSSSINLGTYNTNVNALLMGTHHEPIQVATVEIMPTYNDWRDYQIQIFLYLPYVGMKPLETPKYMGKSLSIKFAMDCFTGKCEYLLFANALLVDVFPGVIGTPLPISGVNSQEYISNVTGAVRDLVSNTENTMIGGFNAVTGGSVGVGGTFDALTGAKYGTEMAGSTLVNATGNVPRFSTGSIGDVISQLEPQYFYMITSQTEFSIPENENTICGLPSNKSGIVGHFDGFLKCSEVKLNIPTATSDEIKEIENLLYTGVYV